MPGNKGNEKNMDNRKIQWIFQTSSDLEHLQSIVLQESSDVTLTLFRMGLFEGAHIWGQGGGGGGPPP